MLRALTISVLLLASPAAFAESGLEKAYLRELAFLKSENAVLSTRLEQIDGESKKRTAQADAELGALEAKLLDLRRRSDEAERHLRDAEVALESADKRELAAETLARAREAVGMSDAKEATPEAVFNAAAELIEHGNRIRKEERSFFLADGKKVDGTVVFVGGIAAYGVSSEGAGALVPTGGGMFRLWEEPAQATAIALKEGRNPGVMKTFLFESADKAVAVRAKKDLATETKSGGVIAYIIVLVGLLASLMIAFRLISLTVTGAATKSFADEIVELVAKGRIQAAQQLARAKRSPIGRVLEVTLRSLNRDREILDDIVHEAVLHELPKIERFGAAIVLFAAVAPLLGLLGTVTGMISTFDVITEFGTGDPRMLSGGIAEALITTKFGLIVAIPTLLLGTLLNNRADSLIADIQHSALRVINASAGVDTKRSRDTDPVEQLPGAAAEPA